MINKLRDQVRSKLSFYDARINVNTKAIELYELFNKPMMGWNEWSITISEKSNNMIGVIGLVYSEYDFDEIVFDKYYNQSNNLADIIVTNFLESVLTYVEVNNKWKNQSKEFINELTDKLEAEHSLNNAELNMYYNNDGLFIIVKKNHLVLVVNDYIMDIIIYEQFRKISDITQHIQKFIENNTN